MLDTVPRRGYRASRIRLLHHATVLQTDGDRYRMRGHRAKLQQLRAGFGTDRKPDGYTSTGWVSSWPRPLMRPVAVRPSDTFV